jgi:hypothetical protein
MRPIKDHERPLIQTCFELAGLTLSDHIRVEPLEDGGMGGLEIRKGAFITRFGIAECHFFDADGVPVSVSLNATHDGKPAELDIWKIDFSPLIRWPNREDIKAGPLAKS